MVYEIGIGFEVDLGTEIREACISWMIYVLPEVVSGAYFHWRGVFFAMQYFPKYSYLSLWSFYKAAIELVLYCWWNIESRNSC